MTRKLYNEELHDLDSSKNIIEVINSRRMRRVVHVARTRETNSFYSFGGKTWKKREHF